MWEAVSPLLPPLQASGRYLAPSADLNIGRNGKKCASKKKEKKVFRTQANENERTGLVVWGGNPCGRYAREKCIKGMKKRKKRKRKK